MLACILYSIPYIADHLYWPWLLRKVILSVASMVCPHYSECSASQKNDFPTEEMGQSFKHVNASWLFVMYSRNCDFSQLRVMIKKKLKKKVAISCVRDIEKKPDKTKTITFHCMCVNTSLNQLNFSCTDSGAEKLTCVGKVFVTLLSKMSRHKKTHKASFLHFTFTSKENQSVAL